jgi:hypothetical protein
MAGLSILARDVEHLNEVKTLIYGISPIKKVLTISADMSKHEDIE